MILFYTLFYMSSDNFLDNSELEQSKFNVVYIEAQVGGATPATSKKTIQIYDDDTIKEVFIKLAVASKKNVTSDHIFAWIVKDSNIIPLGFEYKGITMDHPYKYKKTDPKFIDPNFIDKDGNRKIVPLESTIHKIIEWFQIDKITIKFTTMYDYIISLGFDPKKEITDKICLEKTSFTCLQLFNGKMWKYWPRINDINEFLYFKQSALIKKRKIKIKSEEDIYKRNSAQLDIIYGVKKPIYASYYKTHMFSVSNEFDNDGHKRKLDNNIHLFKLFTDISLGEYKSCLIPFSKITLENYEQTYSKLLKDVISYTGVDPKRFVSKELFLKWYNSQVVSIPNSPVKFMDNTNTVTFKLYDDKYYVTMLIYSNGLIKVLFNDLTNDILKKSFIHKMIGLSNEFIGFLTKKKVYSADNINTIELDYNKSFDSLISNLVYPIPDYSSNIDLIITLFENLSSFVRFNKTQDTMVSCVYKRISDYDSLDSKLRVISLLHNSKRKLNKGQIIKEIEKLFNISEEESIDEYEQWEHLSNGGKIFQSGESGIEFIVDLLGTNLQIDISAVNSYSEFIRIYKFINCALRIFSDFIENGKDHHNLFKKNAKLINQSNSDGADDLELMIESANIVEQENIEEHASEERPSEETTLSKKESKEEKIHSIVSDESTSEVQLENFSEGDSDMSIDLGLETSDSEGGGYKLKGGYKQKGGYNVNRYYLDRLKRYDKELFSGYSVKQHKSTKQKTQKYSYAKKCGAVIGRQPIAVSKTELDKFKDGDEGEGVSYYEAVNIDGRNPDIYYLCPKYWDVKDDRPRDPSRIEEFKEHVVDNKMNAQQKKITDKYILKRDELGYWDAAGDDITRYKIELWDNFHPKGFRVPCCNAPREGADIYLAKKDKKGRKLLNAVPPRKSGWKVDVLINGKWVVGDVYEDSLQGNKQVKIIVKGAVQNIDKKFVRRQRDSKYITNSFPCNLGSFGHVHKNIKHLIDQDEQFPLIASGNNIGLIRQGIKRSSTVGDHSFLDAFQAILPIENPSMDVLKENIISDLESLSTIYSIGGGAFVNKFKLNFNEIKNDKKTLNFIGSQLGLGKIKNDELIHITSKYKTILDSVTSKGGKLIKLFEEKIVELPIIQHAIHKYTAIEQFDKYLNDDNEIIVDQYVIPVLLEISKYPSKTFGEIPIPNLSIVVFEGNSEDVILSPPIGGFPSKSESMILLYKERGHLYEPILYRRVDKHVGILLEPVSRRKLVYDDQNENMTHIINTIQDKINEYNNDVLSFDLLMDLSELTHIMDILDLPILNHIYDNYNKIIHVITNDNVLIPVRPSNIEHLVNCIYYPELPESKYPSYKDVIKTLERIDKRSTFKKYLKNAGLSVVDKNVGSLNLEINEIILDTGHYIPIIKETYNKQIHKLPVMSINSYRDIDHSLCNDAPSNDTRHIFSTINDYKKHITELFFQKTYLMIKDNKGLKEGIDIIKHHDIKLRCHKARDIYKLLEPKVKQIVDLKKEHYDLTFHDEDKNKLIIYSIDDLSSDVIYDKILKLFIELYIIYDEYDYNRFLQLDCSLTKIKHLLKHNELLLTYIDIKEEYYLEHFIRYSQYIRNVSLYGEGIIPSKLIQLQRQKEKSNKHVKFIKQYPQIIRTLFGRNLSLVKSSSDLNILTTCLVNIINDSEEMNIKIIKALLEDKKKEQIHDNYILISDDLDYLSQEYKVGFCLVTQLYTQLLKHDVIIKIHDETKRQYSINDIPMILLYQYEGTLIHIVKDDEPIVKLGELKTELFKKHLKEVFP